MIAIDFRHLNVLIVEDSIKYATVVNDFLNDLEVTKTQIASSYKEAVHLSEIHHFDVLIVDIDLGKKERGGDDFVRFLRKKRSNIPVIYLTSHYEESFYKRVKDTLPTSFLDKNISLLALHQAIELSLNKDYQVKQTDSPQQFDSGNYFIKIGSIYKALQLEDISYIYAKDKAVFIYMKGRGYPMNIPLKELEISLANNGFIRVHKTYLVNLKKITGIDTQNNELHIGEQSVPVGYIYRKTLFSRLKLLK